MEVQHIWKSKDLTQENFELLLKHHFKDPNLKVTEVKPNWVKHEELEKGEHYQSTMKTMIVKIQDRNDLRAKAVHQRTFDNFSCQIAKTKFGLCQRSLLVHGSLSSIVTNLPWNVQLYTKLFLSSFGLRHKL